MDDQTVQYATPEMDDQTVQYATPDLAGVLYNKNLGAVACLSLDITEVGAIVVDNGGETRLFPWRVVNEVHFYDARTGQAAAGDVQ